MRNLKKILALVLALMMVLSVMVTASASYTDAEKIQYTEAVEVMTAAGILNGIADGEDFKFDPNGTLDRASAAKIIAYVLTGGNLESIEDGALDQPYTDAVNSWASKYIAYINYAGIINGNGADKYYPRNNLTGYEFAKMLLNVLGIEGEYTGSNWKLNVAVAAVKAKLTKGMGKDFAFKNNITREEAAQMAFNALQYGGETVILGYMANNNPQLIFDTYLEAYVIGGNNPANVEAVTESTGSILADTFKITQGTLGADELGRPEVIVWEDAKGNAVYTEYAAPLAVVQGETYKPAAKEWKDYNFTGATYLYNGVAGVANWDATDLTKPGVSSEFYGSYNTTTKKFDVSVVVSTEYYFATIADVAANGNISLNVQEAANPQTLTVSAAKNQVTGKQSANYLALAEYAKGTALAILVAPNWENSLTILDVDTVEPVAGAITVIAHDGSYNGSITVGGTKYTFANEYNQAAVNFASKGTFYLHNGLVLGYVAPEKEVVTPDIVFLVERFAKTSYSVDLYTGAAIPEVTYWAQCVTLDGEVVLYQTKNATTGAVNKLCTVTETYDATAKVNFATFAPVSTKTTGALSNKDLKIDGNNYYTSDVKFISVTGALSELEVTVAEGAQNVAAGSNKWYIAEPVTGTTNSTVAYVFVNGDFATAGPVATKDIVYAIEADASIIQVAYINAEGKADIGFQHVVYIDGVKTDIVTTDAAALSGYITLTPVVEGVYSTKANTSSALKDATVVTNMFNGLLSTKDVTDKDVTGVTVVNVSGNTYVPTDATQLSQKDTVALVTDKYGNITLIYVTASTRTK